MYSQAQFLHEWLDEAFGDDPKESVSRQKNDDVMFHVRQYIVTTLQKAKSGSIDQAEANKRIQAMIAKHDLTVSQLHSIHQHLEENPLKLSQEKKEEALLQPQTKQTLKSIGKGLLTVGAAVGASYGAHQALIHHAPMISQHLVNFGRGAAAVVAGGLIGHHLNKPSADQRDEH